MALAYTTLDKLNSFSVFLKFWVHSGYKILIFLTTTKRNME